MDTITELLRVFAGTQAAAEAAQTFKELAARPEVKHAQRTTRARELLAQAREDYRTQQYLCCLDRCEQLAANYGDLPEGVEAVQLGGEIKNNPEWLRRACDDLSDRLGMLTRTNSEAILGAVAADRSADYTRGVAITSSFHPDADTHIEPVRYGKGSNAMALLQTVLADDVPGTSRVRTWLRELWRQRRDALSLYDLKHWSERAVIALVMQSLDNSITTKGVRGRFGWRMTSEQGHGAPNPTYIPIAYEAVRRMAEIIGGTPGGTIGEPFNRPMTAHFIGGCTIGDSPDTGVVDPWQRLYGHEGLHVVDGSHPDPEGQLQAVRQVFSEIFAETGRPHVPEIVVVNKSDIADPLVLSRLQRREKHLVLVSAKTGEGLPELLQVLEDEVPRPDTLVDVVLPYSSGALVSRIHDEGEVLDEEHRADGTRLRARVKPGLAAELSPYLVA